MMKDLWSFPRVESKTVKVVLIKLETGEIVARTVEELEKMREKGIQFQVVEEVK